MSTVCKSAQYLCRAFISINGRRINYKYIIATKFNLTNLQFKHH